MDDVSEGAAELAGWPAACGWSKAWGSREIQATQKSLLHVEPVFSSLQWRHRPHLKGSVQIGEKIPKGLTRARHPHSPREGWGPAIQGTKAQGRREVSGPGSEPPAGVGTTPGTASPIRVSAPPSFLGCNLPAPPGQGSVRGAPVSTGPQASRQDTLGPIHGHQQPRDPPCPAPAAGGVRQARQRLCVSPVAPGV